MCGLRFSLLTVVLLFNYATPSLSRFLQTDNINVKLLAKIKAHMDPNANPCTDFYQYACGNWKNATTGPYNDPMSDLDYRYNQELEQLLENAHKYKEFETNEVLHKIRLFYEACKKQKTYDISRYLDALKPTDTDNWPDDAETWQPSDKWNIWSTLGRLAGVDFNDMFFWFDVLHQADGTHMLELDKIKALAEEWKFFIEQLTTSEDAIGQTEKDILGVIEKLSELSEDSSNEAPASNMTLPQLQKELKNIDIYSYLLNFFGNTDFVNLTISVKSMPYFRKLDTFLQSTSPNTLMQTLKYGFALFMARKIPRDHWPFSCVNTLRKHVHYAMDYMYERLVYAPAKQKTDEILAKVFATMKQKFVQIIQEHTDELSAEEIQRLQEKILKMRLFIGNLPPGVDDRYYEEYFRNWLVLEDDFYGNHIRALQRLNTYEHMLQLAQAPLNMTTRYMFATVTYMYKCNAIIIPFTFMRFPMFHTDFHELFHYALMGFNLGHEILHSVDEDGVKYDSDGKDVMLNIYSKPKFSAGLKCLLQQPTVNLNEKLADFSGFRLAYDTYFQQSAVPDFGDFTAEFSDKQLFFLHYVQEFCEGGNLEYRNYDKSPDRVNQVAANSPEFEEIFGCPLKTDAVRMCKVW